MTKKRKNPFEGKSSFMRENPKPTEEMSFEEWTEELRTMEKALGKERFNNLLEEALQGLNNSEEFDDELYDEEDAYEFDFVTSIEWSQTHPAKLVCGSDAYYAELANDLCDLILDFKIMVSEPEKLARELGRVLAAYLEDIVSDTRIFSSMREVCVQRYGYRLPFYDCEHEDYLPDHINVEDIRFLIWKSVCQLGKDEGKTYSPLAQGWSILAERIFDELNSRYEDAPEARRVYDWLRRAFRTEDYIEIREIASWLVFRNPLSYTPGLLQSFIDGMEQASLEEEFDIETIERLTYGFFASESWQRSMSPMGCPSRTFTAAMAAEFGYDSLAKDIERIQVLPKQIYSVSQDKKSRKVFFETSDHETLEVDRESFAKGFRADLIQFAYCNLVKYKGKYLLNGVLAGDPSLKKEWENQKPMLTFEQQHKLAEEWIGILDGKQVVSVTNLNSFLKKLDFPQKSEGHLPEAENFIILISKESGIAILPDMSYAFDVPGNRFFRKRAASKDSFSEAVFNNSIPHDVAEYIQAHNLLPEACIGASQGKETGRQIVQEYMAFWIGFYCNLPAYGDAPRHFFDDNEKK